jgi:23S rRNA G2445 N2-methylase RlmL
VTEGLLVANPPYGLRLGGGVYRKLKRKLTREFSGWRWGVIECGKRGAGTLGLEGESVLEFSGGGLKLRLLSGRPA